jgi:hypothetical protein
VLLFLAGTATFMVGCPMGSRKGEFENLDCRGTDCCGALAAWVRSTKEFVQEASAGVCWPARRCSKVLDPDV